MLNKSNEFRNLYNDSNIPWMNNQNNNQNPDQQPNKKRNISPGLAGLPNSDHLNLGNFSNGVKG